VVDSRESRIRTGQLSGCTYFDPLEREASHDTSVLEMVKTPFRDSQVLANLDRQVFKRSSSAGLAVALIAIISSREMPNNLVNTCSM
jgi:hypothetical protein